MKEKRVEGTGISEIIHRFRSDIPGFISTDVVSVHSGLSIAGESSDSSFSASIAAAAYAGVVEANKKALRASGLGSLNTEDIIISTDSVTVLIHALGEEYFHLLIIGGPGDFGRAQEIMKQYQPMMLAALERGS